MENLRYFVVIILDKVLNKGAYSNLALDSTIKKANLSELDKGLLTEIVYGTIKYKYTIDIILNEYLKDMEKTNENILNILRMSVYQLKYLNKIPDFAVLNEAVNLAKKFSPRHAKLVNGVLRSYLRVEKNTKFEDEALKLSFDYSFLPWMTKQFIDDYGYNNALLIMDGLNKTPKLTVRVNNIKATFDETFKMLEDLGYIVEKGRAAINAINIIQGKSIESNPIFKKGYITVQDESAQLTGEILDLTGEPQVLDLCSAPGGKTTEIAEILNNKGKVYAFDLYPNKLKLIIENCGRLGINNVEIKTQDARILNQDLIDKGDRVLLDVPCSGLGIIRKKPEIKYTKSLKDINEIIKIQREILLNGSRYLKKGGILLYSTCTLNKKENESNINWFLDKNKDYETVKIDLPKRSNFYYTKEGYLTIFPDEYMDGFFMAKLRRVK